MLDKKNRASLQSPNIFDPSDTPDTIEGGVLWQNVGSNIYEIQAPDGASKRPTVFWDDVLEIGKQYYFDFVALASSGLSGSVIAVDVGNGDELISGSRSTGILTANSTSFGLTIYGQTVNTGGFLRVGTLAIRELPGNHATQSSSSFRPLSKLTYDQYDGSDDRMAGVYPPTAAGTIIARFNGATAGRYVYGSHDGADGRCYLGLDSSGRLAAGIGSQGTSTIVAGSDIRNAWHTGAVTWDETTVNLYLDGAEIYSAAQSGAVNTTVPIYRGCINSNGTPAAFWDGGIGESLIIDRALTADEILKTTNKWST
jgi:hypothetical protein